MRSHGKISTEVIMSDKNLLEEIAGESTRRSVIKKGAAASVGVGLAASGTATAQDDDDDIDEEEAYKALLFEDQIRPGENFIITSSVIEWSPDVPDVQDSFYTDYNTRHIRYLNTSEMVPIFIAEDATLPEYDPELGYVVDDEGDTINNQQSPEVYELDVQSTPFGDNELVQEINFYPVGEDDEEDLIEDDEWLF